MHSIYCILTIRSGMDSGANNGVSDNTDSSVQMRLTTEFSLQATKGIRIAICVSSLSIHENPRMTSGVHLEYASDLMVCSRGAILSKIQRIERVQVCVHEETSEGRSEEE